ncbi:MAG: protein kinase [Saprospiraceae bacterium]|nr:protein kinase [Saprospiraceae bacterium]
MRKVILDIALALEFLHSQSPIIIHRDVKSSNIIITKDGNAKLMDLGIAKIHDLNNIDITRPGAILGTYHFIPLSK